MRKSLLPLLSLASALFAPAMTHAQSVGDVISATFLPGWRQSDGSFVAGIEIDLEPGWKTYWRAPGDAGIPPRFNWAGSTNIGAMRTMWPTPVIMDQNGLTSIGYDHDVVLPLVIQPRNGAQEIKVSGKMEIGVCREICVPASVSFSGTIPVGKGKRDAGIVASLVDQPLSAKEAGVKSANCEVHPVSGGIAIQAQIQMPRAGASEFAVFETDNPEIWVAEASTERKGGQLMAQTQLAHVEGKPFALNRKTLRITVLGSDHAVEILGCTPAR